MPTNRSTLVFNIDKLRRRSFKVFLQSLKLVLQFLFLKIRVAVALFVVVDSVPDHSPHIRYFMFGGYDGEFLAKTRLARRQPVAICAFFVCIRVNLIGQILRGIIGLPARENRAPFLSRRDIYDRSSGSRPSQVWRPEGDTVDEMLAVIRNLVASAQSPCS
jgi:hypothetical protein